nr:Flp family type IVb pilin [Caldimonas tepidiphila]
MNNAITAVKCFWNDEEGAAAIEYGLIAALIAVMIIGGAKALGTELSGIFTRLGNCLKAPAACTATTLAG